MKGWNYMVRLYRPRPEILNGSCKFPEGSRQDEQKIRSVPRRDVSTTYWPSRENEAF
jgi:hypothetical protein